MKSRINFYRALVLSTIVFTIGVQSLLYADNFNAVHDLEIQCACYQYYSSYQAIDMECRLDWSTLRYQFAFEEGSGNLEVTSFQPYIELGPWASDLWGYYATAPINLVKPVNLSLRVALDDIEPGAYRNFRCKYRTRDVGDNDWSGWVYSDEFTVSVSDIDVSGSTGTLCSTSQTYYISPPNGYSSSWTFSQPALVTNSSGTGSSATMSGNCFSIGEGNLTFTMTQDNCPTFTTSRSIKINGPAFTDISLDVRYTDGSSVPKSGSVFLLCPNTHYHITAQNSYGCAISNLSWTLPSGWTKNYQSGNMVSIYTNSNPGGQLILKGQTCCSSCGTNMTLHTGYFGIYYNCGGYYMASPNPTNDFLDLSIGENYASLQEIGIVENIQVSIYDKLGTLVYDKSYKALPQSINTLKLSEGQYFLQIETTLSEKAKKQKLSESIQIVIKH
ncbi:MAG: T9SS type A sorting domain-containing protein [Bacteroidales bacterium]